ncbi:uncharacterized protein [Triticum aestivum]|uniref:uncharacterized protein n=1 Tax=Triticum aestivum TaxID=4565 RepID=UPI001D024633|nr:uncharacterized protein LOC123041116 [Triticum aestivum]
MELIHSRPLASLDPHRPRANLPGTEQQPPPPLFPRPEQERSASSSRAANRLDGDLQDHHHALLLLPTRGDAPLLEHKCFKAVFCSFVARAPHHQQDPHDIAMDGCSLSSHPSPWIPASPDPRWIHPSPPFPATFLAGSRRRAAVPRPAPLTCCPNALLASSASFEQGGRRALDPAPLTASLFVWNASSPAA